MSAQSKPERRKTVPDIRAMKSGTPIVVLTAYTAPIARLLDPHVDILMVGDSLGMVVYGMDSTLPVTLDMMIAHSKAVVNHSRRALVVVDMPFNSYQSSKEEAFKSAARILQETGCSCVKLEGGKEMEETITFLTERGIPVMGHIGLKPQHLHQLGGYKYQGKSTLAQKQLIADAKAVEAAGAFSVVIEATDEDAAKAITKAVSIPTIGIGASPACDGQVLVIDDVLGMSDFSPRFAKRFASLDTTISTAAEAFAKEVRARRFPSKDQIFNATLRRPK
jgi:3-methyl-2-oxobutanoate hydroxymethyltransferase